MKNKHFNLIEYLKSKGFFITKDNVKDKNFKMVNMHVSKNFSGVVASTQNTLKKPIQYVDTRSRIWNFKPMPQVSGGKLIFVDFKTRKIITNERKK